MRWGLAISAMGQTGQSEAIHSPEACARTVVKLTRPDAWSIAVVLHGGDLMLTKRLAHDVEATRDALPDHRPASIGTFRRSAKVNFTCSSSAAKSFATQSLRKRK
jgi:hypothetical protein